MGKNLSEMTLEELWQLFPIFLTGHNTCWEDWYAREADYIRSLLFPEAIINHIGSTAVPAIWAKPIIDILVEIPKSRSLPKVRNILTDNGYICMAQWNDRISFNKGYTEHGFADKVFHLHLRYYGDHDELYFRDYLNDFIDVALQYEKMKRKLWKEYEHDRDGYTNAKSDFVKKYTSLAKAFYQNRYH